MSSPCPPPPLVVAIAVATPPAPVPPAPGTACTVGAWARICCQLAAAAAAAVPGWGCAARVGAPGGACPPPSRAAQPLLLALLWKPAPAGQKPKNARAHDIKIRTHTRHSSKKNWGKNSRRQKKSAPPLHANTRNKQKTNYCGSCACSGSDRLARLLTPFVFHIKKSETKGHSRKPVDCTCLFVYEVFFFIFSLLLSS